MEVIERRENETKKYIVHCANCGSVLRCEWGDFAMYPNFTSITYAFTCPVCNVRQVISGKELDKSVEIHLADTQNYIKSLGLGL